MVHCGCVSTGVYFRRGFISYVKLGGLFFRDFFKETVCQLNLGSVFRLCNPVLYACTYSQFRYQFCKQVNMVKAITLSILKCDWFKMKQLCGLNSSKTIAKLIPIENKTHRNGSSNTNTDFGYGSTNNFLSDSFIASNRTWSSTKS